MSSILKNSTLYLTATIATKAVSFLLLPFYSNLVTPEAYGYVYLVSAISTFLSMFLTLSLPICISRFYFDCVTEKDVKVLYSTILFLIILATTIVFAPLFIFSESIASLIRLPIKYFYAAIVISYLGLFYQLILSLLYVKQEAKTVSLLSIVLGVLQVLLQLTLVIKMKDKSMALIGTLLINSFVNFCVFIFFSRKYLTLSIDALNIKKYLKYSLSQLPSDVSAWLVNFSDRIFINKFIGPAGTGVYGLGTTIGQIPMVIFQSLNSAFTPHVNSQFKCIENGAKKTKYSLATTYLYITSFLICFICTLVGFSNNIVNILNPAYSSTFFIVVIMLLASLMNSMRVMYMAAMAYDVRFLKKKSLIWTVSSILNISLNFVLIPKFGINAACIVSLFTYTITFLILLHFSQKAIHIPFDWKSTLKVSAVSALFCFLLILGSSWIVFFFKILLLPIFYIIILNILKINIKKIFYVKVFRIKQL